MDDFYYIGQDCDASIFGNVLTQFPEKFKKIIDSN